jgi:hypothetical protein
LNKVRIWSDSTRKLLAEKAKVRFSGVKRTRDSIKKSAAGISGERHWNWQGGKTDDARQKRNNAELKRWILGQRGTVMIVYTDWPIAYLDWLLFCVGFVLTTWIVLTIGNIRELENELKRLENQ